MLLVFSSVVSDMSVGLVIDVTVPEPLSSVLGAMDRGGGVGGTVVGRTSSGFDDSMVGGFWLKMVGTILDVVDRDVGLAVILGIVEGVIFGGVGGRLAEAIGATTTLGGADFGTGAGM